MQTINLTAWNNQDFKLTLDMSAWITAGYDLSPASQIRMQARESADDVTVSFSWSNEPADNAPGSITLVGQELVLAAPVVAILKAFPSGDNLVYDVRIFTADHRTITMFSGTLAIVEGVGR